MTTIVTRAGKGSPLTNAEMDANLTNLNSDKIEATQTVALTNKTINLASNTVTGTTAEFNAALSDGNFATQAGSETLSNKVLVSPTIDGLRTDDVSISIASAATVDLTVATGNTVHITGTTTISAFTINSGQVMDVIFDGVLTLTHHSTTNNLPGGANITTAAGDRARYVSDGTTIYCLTYTSTAGTPIVAAPDASTTVKGIVELATDAEVITGTDTTRVPSVASMRNGFINQSTVTASGTSVVFTGIPSWAKKIVVTIDVLSTNGTSDIIIRLGTAGGLATSGYGGTTERAGSGATEHTASGGFATFYRTVAANNYRGVFTIDLHGESTNMWEFAGICRESTSATCAVGCGGVSLAGALTQLAVTTTGGVNTFDGGTITMSYF